MIGRHSYHSRYGRSNPLIVVISKDNTVLENATLATLFKFLPEQAILHSNKNKHEYLLRNGVRIKGISGESKSFEGVNPCFIWIDEAHLIDDYILLNAIARYRRDRIAVDLGRPVGLFATGVPYQGGWLEENFKNKEGRKVFHISIFDNPYLSDEQRKQYLSSCPDEMKDAHIYGRWGAPKDVIYPEWSMSLHLTDEKFDASQPVYLGLDVGNNYSLVLYCQKRKMGTEEGLVVCQEQIFEKVNGTEEVMKEVLRHPLAENIKAICVDPTIRMDELNWIRTSFPKVLIVKREQKTELASEEYGISCVRRLLKDATGTVRLKINRELLKTNKGLFNCFRTYKRKKDGRPEWKDRGGDHSSDALRYVSVYLFPLQIPKGQPAQHVSV